MIDYFGTRHLEGQVPYLPRGFSRPRDDTQSTTSVLHLRRDKLLISRKYFVYKTTTCRLLQYSIFGWDKFPISKDLIIKETTTHRLLGTRFRPPTKAENNRLLQYSNKLSLSYKETTRPQDDNQINYYGPQRCKADDKLRKKAISRTDDNSREKRTIHTND